MALFVKSPTVASLRLSSSISPIRISSGLISTSLRSSSRPAVTSIFSIHSPLKQNPAGNNFAINKRAFSNTPIHQFSPSRITMAGGNVVEIKSAQEFKEKVLESGDAVVLDCFAEWCGPCKAIAPKVAEFSETYKDVKFYTIDVDELSDVAAELGVRAMPTFMFFKGGEKVSDVVGANPPALEAGIKALTA